RRRFVAGAVAAGALAVARQPAGAVVVLDETWRAEGGGPGHESRGFGAHIALAHQPQFKAVMALSSDDGESWGVASSTWIDNVGGEARLLCAGHVFEDGMAADDYVYRTPGGRVLQGKDVVVHPLYNGNVDDRGGYDIADVSLDAAIDDAGPPPLLYAGHGEISRRIVMVGFGSRGLGSVGERAIYSTGSDKAAAENTVDEVMRAVGGRLSNGEDAGNWLGVT